MLTWKSKPLLVSIVILFLATVALTVAQEPEEEICRGYGILDEATGKCQTHATIELNVDYPHTLMESEPLIKETVEQYVRTEQMSLFEVFVDLPFHLDYQSITYQQYQHSDDILSLYFFTDTYAGGAHPYSAIETFTFNLETQEVVTISDIFREEIDPWAVIVPMVSEALAHNDPDGKIPDGSSVDPQVIMDERHMEFDPIFYSQFALDDTTLYFFFPHGRQGPIPAGFFKVELPLMELTDILRHEYQALP